VNASYKNEMGWCTVNFQEQLKDKLQDLGASTVGFSNVGDKLQGNLSRLPYAISVVVRLSDFIIDEIADKPTFT
jgi:epoxyqueuosine reductase